MDKAPSTLRISSRRVDNAQLVHLDYPNTANTQQRMQLLLAIHNCTDDAQRPFRRPSGIVAQGMSRMDAAKGVKGQGRPLYADPGATMERGESGAARPGWRG